MQTVAMRFLSRRRVVFSLLIGVPLALLFLAWRAASWRPVIRQVAAMPILALQWAPDGKTIRCATGTARVETLDATSLSLWSSQIYNGGWEQARFSDNGLLLAEGSEGVCLFDCVSGRTLWTRSYAKGNAADSSHGTSILAIALSPHGDALALSDAFGYFGSTHWLLVKGAHVVPAKNDTDGYLSPQAADSIAFSGDGNVVWDSFKVTSGPMYGGGAFGLRKMSGGKPRWIQLPSSVPKANVYPMACVFSPDNRTLALTLSNGTLLWDVRLNRAGPFLPNGVVNAKVVPAFSSDSRTIATANADQKFDLWNIANGSLEEEISSGDSSVTSLAFSPDNSRLAIGTSDGQVQSWRLQ